MSNPRQPIMDDVTRLDDPREPDDASTSGRHFQPAGGEGAGPHDEGHAEDPVHISPTPGRPSSLGSTAVADTARTVRHPHMAVSISGKSVRLGDKVFKALAAGSGGFLLVIMAAIAAFLIVK